MIKPLKKYAFIHFNYIVFFQFSIKRYSYYLLVYDVEFFKKQ